jgi:flagellin-like hook-associated protein FlgL
VGATQARLDSISLGLSANQIVQSNALSHISDATIAEEMSKITRNSILAQTGAAVLTQNTHLNSAMALLLLG